MCKSWHNSNIKIKNVIFSLIIDSVEFSPYKTWCIPVQSLFTHINWNTPLFGFPTHQPWPQNKKKTQNALIIISCKAISTSVLFASH